MWNKEYKRKWRAKMKAEHRCPNCGKPLDRDGYLCRACQDRENERHRSLKEFRWENYLCLNCGTPVEENERLCPVCLAKESANHRRYIVKHHVKEDKKHSSDRHKKLYYKLKAQGICTKCGKRKAIPGHTRCAICAEKQRERDRKRSKETQEERLNRWKRGLCRFCDNPVEPGYKVCTYHHQLSIKNANDERSVKARKMQAAAWSKFAYGRRK